MEEKKLAPTIQPSNDFWSIDVPEEGVQQYDSSLDSSFNEPSSSEGLNVPDTDIPVYRRNLNLEAPAMEDATTAWRQPEQPKVEIDEDMNWFEMAGKSFVVGLGDMVDSFGDIADFMGGSTSSEISQQVYGTDTSKPISDSLHGFADYLQSYGDDVPGLADLENITWDDLSDIDFWGTGVARMLPFALSLMIPATGAAKLAGMATKGRKFTKAAAAIAKGSKSIGITKYADPLVARGLITAGISTVSAGATANLIEGAALAGQTLNEGVKQGLTEAEAMNAASLVYRDNLASMGADIVQYGLFMGQMGIGKGAISSAQKLGAKFAGTSTAKAVAGVAGKAAAKSGVSALKAPGMSDVIRSSFKAIGMGAAHGVTDGVVEQFQEVFQDWSVQRRIAEAKGEGDEFPGYLDFFLADEQRPTRVLSFATSLLMSGASNTIRTATENRTTLQTAIDERNESHEMLQIFEKDLDKGVYTVKRKVNVTNEDGTVSQKEVVEELSAEEASNWGRDAAAHTMILNAVKQGDEQVILDFFQSKLDSGNISEEQHSSYKGTFDEIKTAMEGKPTNTLDNKGKTELVYNSWLHSTSKIQLNKQKEALQAKIDEIQSQVDDGPLTQKSADQEIAGLKELSKSSLQAQEEIVTATESRVNEIYSEAKDRKDEDTWNKDTGKKLEGIVEKELKGEDLTAEEQALTTSDDKAKGFYSEKKLEGQKANALKAAKKKAGRKFKGYKANAASSKDGTYVYTKRNEKDNTLSVITVSPDGSVEMKTDTIDENLSEIDKKAKEKSEAKTEKEKALREEKEKARDEKDTKEEKKKNITEKNSQFKGKVISPSALALANKLDIDLEESGLIGKGKGKNGRLTKADIENYKPEVKAEEKVEEKGKETIPKYLTGSNIKATAKLALDAVTGVLGAFFNKERAVRIVDKVEAALHKRKIRRAYMMGKGSQRTLANLYAKKSADGLISVQFLDEIYSRGDEGAAYAMGLGVFINPDAATDSAEEAIFHENFHIFRMLYGHLKEVKDMMRAIVGQPVYKTTRLEYQEELLYFFLDKEGNKNTMTQEEALEYLKLKQENASQQEMFSVITSVEKYALENKKDITEELRKEFYESSLNVLTQAGFVELKDRAQVHIQDEALAKLGGLYGSVNQDLFISGQNKTEYNSRLKAWKEKIKDSVTEEEAESAFEAVSKGLYKAKGKQSLEEKFKNVKKLIADNEAKYGAYTVKTQQALKKKLLKQSRVIDDVKYLLNDMEGSVHKRAKAFVATELDALLEVDKKENFTANELSKYIQEKLLLTESINKSYVDIASDILSDYHNTKDYKEVLQIIRNNEGTIKALIRNQHLTGLTAEASKVLSKRLSESDSAYLKALEDKFSKAQKEVLSTDNNGDELSIDADDIFSAMIDDNPQQLSDKLYSIIEFHLQVLGNTYKEGLIGKDKLLFHVKSFAEGAKSREDFISKAHGLIDALKLQEEGKSWTWMEAHDEHVARFLKTLIEQYELMPKTAVPYTKKGAAMTFGSVLGGLHLQMNSMTTEKGLFLTADGYAPALSRQDSDRVQSALRDAVMFGSEFSNKQLTGNVPLGLLTKNVNAVPTNQRQAGMLSQLRKRILYTRNLARLVYAPNHSYKKGERDKDLLHFINAFFLPFGTNESGASFNFNKLALDEFRIYDEETSKNLTLREYFEGDRLKALYNQSISFDLNNSVKDSNVSLEALKTKANADVFMPFFIAEVKNKIGGAKIQDGVRIDRDIMSQIRDDFNKQIEEAYDGMEKFPVDKESQVEYVQTLPESGLTNSPKGPEYQRSGKVTRQIKFTELKTEKQKEDFAKKNGLMSFSTSGIQPGERIWEREIVKEWKTSERGSIAMYTVTDKDGGLNNSSSLNDLQGHKKLAQAVIATFNSEHNEGYMSTILTPEGKTLNLNTRKYFLEYNADSLRDFMEKNNGMPFAELFSYAAHQNPYAMRALEGDYKLEFLSLLGDSVSELDRQNISSVGITEGDINEINRALKSGSKEYNQVVRDYSDKSRRYYAKATVIPADNQYNLEGGIAIFLENAVSNPHDFTLEQLRAIDKHLKLVVDITATKSQKESALKEVQREYVMAVTTELQAKMGEVVDYHNAKTNDIIANHNSDNDFDLFKVTSQATIDSLLSEGYYIKNSDTQKSKVKGELNLLGKLAFQQTIDGKIQYLNEVETHIAMMNKLGRSPLDAVASMNYFTNKFWLQDLNANTMEEQNFSMKNKRSTGLIAPHDSSYAGNRVETIIFDDQDLDFENESQKVQIYNYETKQLEYVKLTPKLADSASYITQEEATRLEGNHGGLADVKGSFKLVGYGRNVDNKRIASHTGQKSNQFYFKGHTIVLNNKVRGPLSGVYKSLKAREKFYSDKGLKNHRVLSYADSGVKKFNIKGVNTFSLEELNSKEFDLNGRLDKWGYDEVNNLRGFDGRFFGVQNELDKEANSATVAKQGISNMNVFADHWDTNVQGLSQKVMNAYALALDLQYEEEIASLTYEELAKQDMESSSMPPVQAVMFQEGNDSLPTIRARVLELANSKLRKKGFKLRTEGTLSLQESDIIQGFEISGEGKLVETSSALKPISVSGTEGNLKVSHAEASISQHMAKMLGVTKEDVAKSKASGKEILFLATRIPASSAGSTVVLRVAAISDKQGNTIAVNSKTSSIMGADLDGDMLHINMVETGKDLTDLQNAKNDVIQSIIDLYSEPSVVNMLIQEIEIDSTTKSSNLALFGNEEGSTEVNNDLGLLGTNNLYETTKGNVPMIGIIASQNLMYNYISQGNPELMFDSTAISFQMETGKPLTTLDNVVGKDGTGTYYEVCKYLNLVLDDGKNNNRANFQFIKETAGQFIMMMKYGVKPAEISTSIRDMNWAALKGLNSKEIYDMAESAASVLAMEYSSVEDEMPGLNEIIHDVFNSGGKLAFNVHDIAAEAKFERTGELNPESMVGNKAMLLYYVTSQIGQDLKDLSLFVGLDKNFTANPLDNLIQHQAALEALKVQPSIDERLRAKNPLYKRQLEANQKLIQKAIDESAELSNGYAEGLLGDYNFEEVKGTAGILGVEMIEVDGSDIPLGIFNKNLNGLVSNSELISQLTKALTLSRALVHSGYDVANKILQLGGMFEDEMGLTYEEFAALPTNAGKLVHLTTAAGNVAKAFQNDNSNNQNKWLGVDGILKVMPTKGYITEKGKTQVAGYVKFDIDVAKLQRELEFTEHVDIYRKDFEKLPESLKRFLVFNDLLSTGWGSKNPGKSMIPYMSAAYSSKVNSMFSAINDSAVSNFTDDMAIMKERLSHIMNFTGDNELDNRRIALVLQLGLNGPNSTMTIDQKTGESKIKNKHNGGLFSVRTKKIGANPLNQVSEIVFDKQAMAEYREVNPSETFPFQYGKGIPYFNQFPELSMLNTMEALTKVKHAENGVSVHEVNKGPKKKFLKIASHSRNHFGDTGVAYTKKEYAAKVLPKGQTMDKLSEEMLEDFNLRFKVYKASVKRAAEINKEISKELDDTIYRLDHKNKEASKIALDKKFQEVRDIYANLRDSIDKGTVVIGKESYKLDSMAFDTLLRLAQYNFGNHIAEKQIADWEYAHGKKFVETVINDQHKHSKDISTLTLWMSPGDFGKTKPAVAYINKNIKMTHMKYTRNISLVAKEMNDKLDSLFKHKFGSDLVAKGVKAWMAYIPIGTMGYSEKLFENFYQSHTGLEKITDKKGKVSYRDRSNLELHPELFNKSGKHGNTISLKREGKKYASLHESEREYIEMYVKYTNFYRELIVAKGLYKTTKGANYVANINSSTWETYHRRGLFGMYYQMFKGDEMFSDVMIKGVNPITGEPATLDYFSWKAIFMHAPGESFKISRAQIVKGGVKMISSQGHSKQVMTGAERIKAYKAIQDRAQELWDNKKDDNDNDINVISPVNEVMALESEEAVNRYTHKRSMTSGYLATHNIHQALNTYVRDFMFLHGNMFYDPKAKVWNTLSWAGDDKALEHSYISDEKVTDSRYSGLKHIRSNEGDASLKDYKLAFSGFNDKTAEIDAAMSSLGDNHINARKFLQKVVKEGFLLKEKSLTVSDKTIRVLNRQPEKVLANFFTQWTMYIALGFNIPAAKGNVLIGKYNAYRQAGGKALIKGEARYWGLSSDKIYDNPARLKARKMIDELGILTYRAEELAEGLGASSLSSLIFYPMVAAENWIQQAQFLGQLTQKQWDGYFIDKNGDLKFNGAEEDRLTQQDVADLERKVIDVQGRGYSETDVRYIQLFSLGTMAMQFKRWFPTFLADRFKNEDVDDLGNLRMGSVIGARKFISRMHKEGKLWKFSEFKKELDENFKPHEREAVMRVFYGTNGIMVASLLYAIAIASSDDDEPEDETAKLFEKLLGDMLLLGNVPRLTYMTNIPAVDTIENLALALYHTAKQTEYQRKAKYGDKGDLKAVANFARLLPAPLRKPLQLDSNKNKRQRPLN